MLQNDANWPSNRSARLLPVGTYGKTILDSFSGTAYYLAVAGINAGVIDGSYNQLSSFGTNWHLRTVGAMWKTKTRFLGRRSGGFKFTPKYQSALWRSGLEGLNGVTLINTFQLFGEPLLAEKSRLGIKACFYIDGTLREYFSQYGKFDTRDVDRQTQQEALDLERIGYEKADTIIAMSRHTAEDLERSYGIKRTKIHVVPPGANLPDSAVSSEVPSRKSFGAGNPFLLGFVGLYPQRKGLDRIAAAVQILRKRNLHVNLRIIGNCPPEIGSLEGVEYLGRINKRTQTPEFIAALSQVHLGCMLSCAELAGIAYLEFLRLGIPVVGTNVGGSVNILEQGGSIIVPPSIEPEELANRVERLYRDQNLYLELCAGAIAAREWAGWPRVVSQIDSLLSNI